MDKIQEFYDMLAPIAKQINEQKENIYALYNAIEDDLSIPDDGWIKCQDICEAITTIAELDCDCGGDCTCGNPV